MQDEWQFCLGLHLHPGGRPLFIHGCKCRSKNDWACSKSLNYHTHAWVLYSVQLECICFLVVMTILYTCDSNSGSHTHVASTLNKKHFLQTYKHDEDWLANFLLLKIYLSRFYVCIQQWWRDVGIQTNKNNHLVSIRLPTIPKVWQARNPTSGSIASCKCHHHYNFGSLGKHQSRTTLTMIFSVTNSNCLDQY